MGLQQRLMDEQMKLKMYIKLAELYGNRSHSHKLTGVYEDPIYGRYNMNDVKQLVFLLEGLTADILYTGSGILMEIELSTNTANLSL